MNLQLTGKRALVTGSSSGIGTGIAATLAAEGVTVVVHGRDVARTKSVVESLRATGAQVSSVTGDLSHDAGASAVAEQVLSLLGGIDILINNAGGRSAPTTMAWLDVATEDWAATYEQNVGAAVRMIRHFVPGMRERGFGRIVQIASAAATQTEAGFGEYQAAKAAVVNLGSSLAKALAHTGITVNTVSPGMVLTPALERWLHAEAATRGWQGDQAELERRMTTEVMPLCVPRIGRVDDIGRAVAFLVSPLNGYITGANFRVDGGQCRSVN